MGIGKSSTRSRNFVKQADHDNCKIRIFNDVNNLKFNQLIQEENWSEITDANLSYNKFKESMLKIITRLIL